ncbi:MAG: hypothetical protein M3Y73_07295 [Actinomycetota bacterium]|nr:hypothetical protein [Actinomycetota bacterium]
MTRLIAGRPGDGPGGAPPTAQAAASPEVSPSASPEQSNPTSDTPTEGELDRATPTGVVLTFPDGCQRLTSGDPALTAPQLSELVVTRPTTSPAEVEGIDAHEARLAQAARGSSSVLPMADAVAAVELGMLADAVDMATGKAVGAGPVGRGVAVAAKVGQAAVAVQRHGLPPTVATPVDWSGFGQVIPVLSGSPGAGASVLCAVISDVLQLAARCVLVVDTADPARSGLALATKSEGPWGPGPHSSVRIRFAWRAQALLARVETSLPVLTPGMVPAPRFWRPAVPELHATVVDVGHDAWRVSAHPLIGAGEWLRRGTPAPRPVLVVRPTRPSLIHAEQVLARLESWVQIGAVTAPAQLVVMGAKRWPARVAGVAGRRVAGLVEGAVFVPHDPGLAVGGITTQVTPAPAQDAVTPLLRSWGLLPAIDAKAKRSWRGRW